MASLLHSALFFNYFFEVKPFGKLCTPHFVAFLNFSSTYKPEPVRVFQKTKKRNGSWYANTRHCHLNLLQIYSSKCSGRSRVFRANNRSFIEQQQDCNPWWVSQTNSLERTGYAVMTFSYSNEVQSSHHALGNKMGCLVISSKILHPVT